GAVFGSLFAGFYLLRLYDMSTATYVASAMNATVAGIAVILAARIRHVAGEAGTEAPPLTRTAERMVYVAIGLSGLDGLGAEVVWTRLLSLLFGGTVYTFSIITGVFLIGLGIGSSVAARLARTAARPGTLFAVSQAGVALSIAWAALLITQAYPYWPIDP